MSYAISGNAVLSNGSPAAKIFVRDYTTGTIISTAIPDALGDYSITGLDPSAGYEVVAHGASGYAPGIHGPVTPISNGITEAVLNSADKGANVSLATVMGFDLSMSTSGGQGTVRADIAKSSGKWYWEVSPTAGGTNVAIGVATSSASLSTYPGGDTQGWCFNTNNTGPGFVLNNASVLQTGLGVVNLGEWVGVALDMDNQTLRFHLSSGAVGTLITGLPSTLYPAVGAGAGGSTAVANFGQTPFQLTVPSGFTAGVY